MLHEDSRRRKWAALVIALPCLALCWAQTARAQVKLEYKFPEGKKLKYKTTVEDDSSIDSGGAGDRDPGRIRPWSSSSRVGKRRDDSTLPIEQKVESLRVELSLPGGINLNFDSSEPNAKIDNPQLAFLGEVFKLAAEIGYTVVLDDQNKVKAIEGTEKLLEKAEKLEPSGAGMRSAAASSPTRSRSAFEQEHRHLPDVLARPGESWERTEILDVGSGQTLTFRKKYEYAGTEKRGTRRSTRSRARQPRPN